jgi:hypothetical protein
MINEDEMSVENKKERCTKSNVASLQEIMGDDEDIFEPYTKNVKKRKRGIKSFVDTLDLMKTLRMHDDIPDKGEHLAYDLLQNIESFKNKKYFDETNGGCINAMDKIIELYKENEHGEDLVKDIEKVINHRDPSDRAKEYLKACIRSIKSK